MPATVLRAERNLQVLIITNVFAFYGGETEGRQPSWTAARGRAGVHIQAVPTRALDHSSMLDSSLIIHFRVQSHSPRSQSLPR